jgi:hypothetical protein
MDGEKIAHVILYDFKFLKWGLSMINNILCALIWLYTIENDKNSSIC